MKKIKELKLYRKLQSLRKWQKVLLAISIFLLCFTGWMIWGNLSLEVTNYTITSERIPVDFDGFRIVQISDFHDAEFGENNHRLVEKIRKIKPDIIVLTGDFIDSFRPDMDNSVNLARQAVEIAPTYYVTGNHEKRLNDPTFYTSLEEAGVIVLQNESVMLTRGQAHIELIGLKDASFNVKKGTKEVLSALMPKEDAYTVVLSHQPELFDEYVSCGPDLVLSGHIHGGQFRLPFIGGLYAPNQGIFPEYDAGLYVDGKTSMIISRGLGNSRFPIRFNNRPEIVVVTLKTGK